MGCSELQDGGVYSDAQIWNHFLQLAYEVWKNTPPKNLPLWDKDYFETKGTCEIADARRTFSSPLFFLKRGDKNSM